MCVHLRLTCKTTPCPKCGRNVPTRAVDVDKLHGTIVMGAFCPDCGETRYRSYLKDGETYTETLDGRPYDTRCNLRRAEEAVEGLADPKELAAAYREIAREKANRSEDMSYDDYRRALGYYLEAAGRGDDVIPDLRETLLECGFRHPTAVSDIRRRCYELVFRKRIRDAVQCRLMVDCSVMMFYEGDPLADCRKIAKKAIDLFDALPDEEAAKDPCVGAAAHHAMADMYTYNAREIRYEHLFQAIGYLEDAFRRSPSPEAVRIAMDSMIPLCVYHRMETRYVAALAKRWCDETFSIFADMIPVEVALYRPQFAMMAGLTKKSANTCRGVLDRSIRRLEKRSDLDLMGRLLADAYSIRCHFLYGGEDATQAMEIGRMIFERGFITEKQYAGILCRAYDYCDRGEPVRAEIKKELDRHKGSLLNGDTARNMFTSFALGQRRDAQRFIGHPTIDRRWQTYSMRSCRRPRPLRRARSSRRPWTASSEARGSIIRCTSAVRRSVPGTSSTSAAPSTRR